MTTTSRNAVETEERFDKEQVREATDLEALIGERTKLTGPRRDLRGKCPLHGSENPFTLSVNAEKGVWDCKSCGEGGDCFTWVMIVEKVEFPEAVRILAGRGGVTPTRNPRPEEPSDPIERLAAIRGWTPDALHALGAVAEGGLVAFPMRDAGGELVGWKERRGDNLPVPVGRGETTKSKSRRGSQLGLFYPPDLSELPDPVLAVEGEADATAALTAGYAAVVGTSGASASRASLDWLQELVGGREVVVAPDPDAAGRSWRDRLGNRLANAGCTVRLIAPGEGDLDDRLRAAEDPAAELARLVAEARPYEPPEEDPELAAFVDAKGHFVHPRIAEALHARAPVFALRDRLHRYEGGVYRPEGEASVRADLADLLGEQYTIHTRREVVAYLCDRYPLLAEGGGEATDRLDPDPHLLNVANGLLDVRDLTLHDHDPGYLSTLQVPHEWAPDADCPRIHRFLGEVFPPDAVELAYEFIGSLLRRDLNPEKVLLAIGDGDNGKSLFIDLLGKLVGARNCSAVTVQQLDESRFHVINLLGKLANFCADLPATALRETSTFKRAVSGDPIEGEWKGVQPITFRPFCKFVFSCNKIPSTRDTSHAFYRRWLPVEFPNRFVDPAEYDQATAPPHHHPARDRGELLAELRDPAELRGLMNRSLRAAQHVADRGGRYSQPDSVEAAQERFRLETDTVAEFTAEHVRFVEGAVVARQFVYNEYARWAEAQGFDAEPQHVFNARLEERGAKRCLLRTEERRVKGWRGVSLTLDEEPPQNY